MRPKSKHRKAAIRGALIRLGMLAALGPVVAGLLGCGPGPWNNPYPDAERQANVIYRAFQERPKHLDPARSYSSNEIVFTGQIYEPPLQYHYLKRPYELVPLTAREVPTVRYLDARSRPLPDDAPAERIAYSVYEVRIRPGIYYQPHPAFAKRADGSHRYHDLNPADLQGIDELSDFEHTGTRELVAADYVYQIKRLAHPDLNSPILSLMSEYIVGLGAYARTLAEARSRQRRAGEGGYLDLTRYPLEGARVIDRYTYRIKIKGRYPQLLYWLAMPFFAPVPPEAARFHRQAGMEERNITLDWYPVGTGPYMLTENNPNRRMLLERNPNFHGERYPAAGEPADREAGLLDDAGMALPFVDRILFSLEKESIPYWNKFLQGYYDVSGVSSDSFDQAIRIGSQGEAHLSENMRAKDIELEKAVAPSVFYMGFNMRDPVVGGYGEAARKLRRAVSIAVDFEEYISIFLNGRGVPAQGPLPPGIFGYRAGEQGINPYVYEWQDGEAVRKPIGRARELLAEAGYPDGVSARTGRPLVLHLDVGGMTGPDAKARLDWYRKQFRKLNVQLVVRNTTYNRFQDKMLKGTAQIFMWGWNADYPDPENFLFLLYGPNRKFEKNGENAANYRNPEFDRLFEQMKNMRNGPERQEIIDRVVAIARRDAPWVWGYYPKDFTLTHSWHQNFKTNQMANNTMKYLRVDPAVRAVKRRQWNGPVLWPLWLFAAALVAAVIPAAVTHIRREYRSPGAEGRG